MAIAPIAPVAFSAADLALVAFMLVCIVALGVLRAIRAPSVSIAGGVPAVGGALAEALTRGFAAAESAVLVALHASLAAFSRTVEWLQGMWSQLSATAVGLAQLTYAAIHTVATVTVPHLIALAEARAAVAVTAARAYSLGLFHDAQLHAAALVAGAEARSLALYQQATAGALLLFRTAEHDAALAVAAAEANAVKLADAERAFTVSAAAELTAHADQLFAQAMAAVAAAEVSFGGQLGRVAGAEADQLRTTADALQKEIDAARAAVGSLAAGSVAAIAADVAILKALRCLKFCDALADIGEFSSLLDLGLIFILIEAARADPKGLQQFMAGTLAPLLRAEIPNL